MARAIFTRGKIDFVKDITVCPAVGSYVEVRDKFGNLTFAGEVKAVAWTVSELWETARIKLG